MHKVLIADICEEPEERETYDPRKKAYNSAVAALRNQYIIRQIDRLRSEIIVVDLSISAPFETLFNLHVKDNMAGYNPVVCHVDSDSCRRLLDTLTLQGTDFLAIMPKKQSIFSRLLDNSLVEEDTFLVEDYEAATLLTSSAKAASKNPNPNDGMDNIDYVLLRLGATKNLKSIKTIKNALTVCIEDNTKMHYITKNLYPTLARLEGVSQATVERRLRYAINVLQRSNSSLFSELFPYSSYKSVTNSGFISTVVDYLLLSYGV